MTIQEKTERKGMAARQAAMKRFMEAHPEEFAKILREEREKRGLFPTVKKGRVTNQMLQEELEAARAEIAKLKGMQGHSS